jgi:hypothetical protein
VSQSRRTLLLVAGFCLAVAATLFFGYRAERMARRVRWQNEGIEPWMSVPFVAHTHHRPAAALFEAVHERPDPRDRRPIRDIARAEHVPVDEVIHELEDAMAKAQPDNPPDNSADQR